MIHKSYKTELDPNDMQRTAFHRHAGVARFAYNWGLARRMEEWEVLKNIPKKDRKFTDWKKEFDRLKPTDFPWAYEVSNAVHQIAFRHLDRAFKNFYKDTTKGFPQFRSRKKNGVGGFSFGTRIHTSQDSICFPHIGWVKLKEKNYLPSNVKWYNTVTVTVKERAGRWFVSIQWKEEIEQDTKQKEKSIALDFGISSFITGSDGNKTEPLRPLTKALRKLKKLQRSHSRKQKVSNNREKSRKKLSVLHYKIANLRKEFQHQLSTKLAKTKSAIVIEDLSISNMVKNHKLARLLSDAGWSEFVRMLEYKCLWYGSRLIKIGRFDPSTKRCSYCGLVKKEMSLSERTYHCEQCGMEMDRDINAAKNILYYGMKQLPIDRREVKPTESGSSCSGKLEQVPVDEAGTQPSVS